MRALFASTRGAGHVVPLLPFARALDRAGHDVVVAVPRSAVPLVERAGVRPWPIADPSSARFRAIADASLAAGDEAGGVQFMREAFAGLFAGSALDFLLTAVERWRPDVVLRETHEFASALVAERRGVPQARIGIMRAQGEAWAVSAASPALEPLRARLGLAPDPGGRRLLAAPLLTLTPRQLEDPAAPAPADALRFREPAAARARPLPDWWPGDERPLVYVTFGSEIPRFDSFPALLRTLLHALAGLDVRVLATIGDDLDPATIGPVPPNARVERWVPQAQVMPHAAAVLCHGGSGTVRGALAAGLPLVVLPSWADQPANARRVAELGAGIALDPTANGQLGEGRSAGDAAAAVRLVLEEERFRAAAEAIAADIARLPSVNAVAGVLRDLLRRSALSGPAAA